MSEIERSAIERAIFNINYFERDMDKTTRVEKDLFDALEIGLTLMRAELEREKNPPLTIEELREMVDSPIFVIFDTGSGFVKKWEIPYMVEDMAHCQSGENWYPSESCKIYRYEPKGEPNV